MLTVRLVRLNSFSNNRTFNALIIVVIQLEGNILLLLNNSTPSLAHKS